MRLALIPLRQSIKYRKLIIIKEHNIPDKHTSTRRRWHRVFNVFGAVCFVTQVAIAQNKKVYPQSNLSSSEGIIVTLEGVMGKFADNSLAVRHLRLP